MHPFYVPKKGWTSAIDLRAGDILVMLNGEYVVVEQVQHELLESSETTYNFEVEDYHTYYVGENPILVHNTGCGNKLDSRTVAGPEDVGRYKNVRIDVEVGGSGKTNIHMTARRLEKMYYNNGTFPTAPRKLVNSEFVKKGLAKAFDYIRRAGLKI